MAGSIGRIARWMAGLRGGGDAKRRATLEAIGRSQGLVEFALDGTIRWANPAFLDAMGYRLDEIRGRPHAMFMPEAGRASPAYAAFWAALARGEAQAGTFMRLGREGREVWIQAAYTPLLDRRGRPVGVIKAATDITAAARREADLQGRIDAIDASMAVIEFGLDGRVLRANANFLRAMGYAASEVEGRHHAMFMPPEQRDTEGYRAFWRKLAGGAHDAGRYRRLGRGGREVWIQASYNPVFDPAGRPVKVVKYASDITAEVLRDADATGQVEAIRRVQAVVEFDLDGVVLAVNDHFRVAMGCVGVDVAGRHHRGFMPDGDADAPAYAALWAGLREGHPQAGRFRRRSLDGREVWLEASYNPILDPEGRPRKVVKYATDITREVQRSAAMAGLVERVDAFGRHHAVAERDLAAANLALAARAASASDAVREGGAALAALHGVMAGAEASARQADALSREGARVADEGAGVVAAAVEAMDEIRRFSSRIASITGLMDAIAFQTNLLALNAAVEAARAGDQGRGFAVVAGEVRSLAQRAGEASTDIRRLVEQSGDAVGRGASRVQAAGASLASMGASVGEVVALMQAIAEATRAQGEGLVAVEDAFARIDADTADAARLAGAAGALGAGLGERTRAVFDDVARVAAADGAPVVAARPAAPPARRAAPALRLAAGGRAGR